MSRLQLGTVNTVVLFNFPWRFLNLVCIHGSVDRPDRQDRRDGIQPVLAQISDQFYIDQRYLSKSTRAISHKNDFFIISTSFLNLIKII